MGDAPFPNAFPPRGVVSPRDIEILKGAAVHHDRASVVGRVATLSARQVRNIWRKGEQAGFIVKLRGSWPMWYDKGPRWAELESPNAPFWTVNTLLNSKTESTRGNGLRARTHNAMLTFRIERAPPASAWDAFTWRREWTQGRQGVSSRSTTLYVPEREDRSCVEIRGSTLVVYPFPIYARTPDEFAKAPTALRDAAKQIAHSAVQSLGIAIADEPELARAEYAIEGVDSIESLHLSNIHRFRLGPTWTDSSKGAPEWETTDYQLAARTFLFLWAIANGKATLVWKDDSTLVENPVSTQEVR
jgi:hypothetical protein